MPDNDALDALTRAEQLADEIEDTLNNIDPSEISDLTDRLDKLKKLKDKIDEARDHPETLDGEKVKDLVVDLIMIIPDNLPIPDHLKKLIRILAKYIGLLLGAAYTWSQTMAWNHFIRCLRTSPRPLSEEAIKKCAKRSSWDKGTQRWVLINWKIKQLHLQKPEDDQEDEASMMDEDDHSFLLQQTKGGVENI